MKRILIITLLFCGCNPNYSIPEIREGGSNTVEVQELKNSIVYLKDSTTNLCFAVLKSYNNKGDIYSFTCVPCDSIKKLLK